jgi:predicted glycosyltransferase
LFENGHDVLVTSRDKDVTVRLLDEYEIPHQLLSRASNGTLIGLSKELLERDFSLYKVVKKFRPDVMASIGGTFIAQVGALTRTPSLVFYDTENARLQNRITYPFARRIYTPECYEGWVPKHKHTKYSGYHELSYLHPAYFTPSVEIASSNGLVRDSDNFLIRVVSWQANHDVGESGWSEQLLSDVVNFLKCKGNVLVSTEAELPPQFDRYIYKGEPGKIHHLLAYCRLLVGESATMSSEAAILGVPSVYCARVSRGYTNQLEREYQLVSNVFELEWPALKSAIDSLLKTDMQFFSQRRSNLLETTVDVTSYITNEICSFCNH